MGEAVLSDFEVADTKAKLGRTAGLTACISDAQAMRQKEVSDRLTVSHSPRSYARPVDCRNWPLILVRTALNPAALVPGGLARPEQ